MMSSSSSPVIVTKCSDSEKTKKLPPKKIHIILRVWPDYLNEAPELASMHEETIVLLESDVMGERALTWREALPQVYPALRRTAHRKYFVKRLEFINPAYRQFTWEDKIRSLIEENVNRFVSFYAVIVGLLKDPAAEQEAVEEENEMRRERFRWLRKEREAGLSLSEGGSDPGGLQQRPAKAQKRKGERAGSEGADPDAGDEETAVGASRKVFRSSDGKFKCHPEPQPEKGADVDADVFDGDVFDGDADGALSVSVSGQETTSI